MARVSDAQTKAVGRGLVEKYGGRLGAAVDDVLDARGHARGGQAVRVHRAQPAGAAVLADRGVLAPADPRDAGVAAVDEVLGGERGAGGAVDVDPHVAGLVVVPRPAEGDERGALLAQPRGLRVAEVGVGDDEGVHGRRAQQVVVAADRVLVVAREEQDVVARLLARLDQRVHEPVHRGVGGALLGGGEAQADQGRRAGAEVAGGAVGRVAELGDRLAHPLEGVGAQQVGVVDGVGDRLARHPGALGDVGEGGRRDRQRAPGPVLVARHDPLPIALDRSNRGEHKPRPRSRTPTRRVSTGARGGDRGVGGLA